jgi:hypothetical protein
MSEHVDLQFRPSLIIFVGDTGRQIHEQFFGPEKLLANLDQSLRQSVGLLYLQAQQNEIEPLPSDAEFPADPDIPRNKGSMQETIYRSLVSVQLDRRRLAVNTAGYAMPNPRTQILIVGDLEKENALQMAEVLRIVREMVLQNGFDTNVCYFLNSYKPLLDDHSPKLKKYLDDRATSLKWIDYEVANFCYLYEHMIRYPFPVFVGELGVRYATAEALLALVATGISSSLTYDEEMRLPARLEDYGQRVGSMSTIMIKFPRVEAREYCSILLSCELIQKWQDDLNRGHIADAEYKGLLGSASSMVDKIKQSIEDSMPRPLAEKSLCPSLDILRKSNLPTSNLASTRRVDLHYQLLECTKDLFTFFSYEAIYHEYSSQKYRYESWSDVANKRFDKTMENSYVRWESKARQAWEAASNRIEEEIKDTIDDLWAREYNGLGMARIYVVELDNRLSQLADEIAQWGQRHDIAYQDAYIHFKRLTEERDNWEFDDIKGGGTSVITNSAPSTLGSQCLPAHEEEIAYNLKQRAEWKQHLLPSLSVLIAISFLAWTMAVLMLGLFHLPPGILISLGLSLVAFIAVGGLMLRYQYQQQVTAAQQDILNFYRCYYIYRCEKFEDAQRDSLMMIMRSRVISMRKRFEDMSTFLSNIRSEALKDAEQISDQLFNGPAGIHDIFIANGERLQRHGKYTLNDVAKQVTRLRTTNPLEEWHRTSEKIKNELIRIFRTASVSLIDMTSEDAQKYINDFTRKIVDHYIIGSLVSISAALDKPEIWREVFDRVGKPLYSARVGICEPRLRFVCGCSQDLRKSLQYIPSDAITVETKSPEWLLVAAFFRGGEPTALNTDNLFLPKSGSASANMQAQRSTAAQTSPPQPIANAQNLYLDDDATRPRRQPFSGH